MSEVEQGQQAETIETVVENTVTEEAKVETTEAPEGQEQEVDWKARAEKAEKKIQRQRKALSALQQDAVRAKHLETEIQKLKQALPSQEPKIDDFETTDDFLNAKAEHLAEQKANKKLQDSLEAQKQALVTQTQQERDREFQKAEFNYVQQNPSYEASKAEVRGFINELGVAPNAPVIQAIYEQADAEGNLPQIIDYFGKNDGENLGELEQILALSPVRAAAEIAKIQLRLKPSQQQAALPKPLKPVSGGAKSTRSLEKMSYEELKKTIFKK